MSSAARVFVGLGSNMGDSIAHLRGAIEQLSKVAKSPITVSRFYGSRPWGDTNQSDFVNAVISFDTHLCALELLNQLLGIENLHGRDRASSRRNGPRTLDLDLLLYANDRVDVPGLHLPHPHIAERAFVVLPLLEIAPELEIPGLGPISSLMQADFASLCWPLDSIRP